MKSQDIVVLLKFICLQQVPSSHTEDLYSMRSLADVLAISKSEINNSINRSLNSGLLRRGAETSKFNVNRQALLEFIVTGLKYVFPIKPGALARGIPTSFAAPALQEKIMSAGDDIFVWPDANGEHKGQAIEALFKTVPFAVKSDPNLYAYLALIDALRLGNPRESNLAKELLEERLMADA